MNIIDVSYADWKTLVQGAKWKKKNIFHITHATRTNWKTIYAGTVEYVFRSRVTEDDHTDWSSKYSSKSVEVDNEDEVLSAVLQVQFGKKASPPQTSDGREIFLSSRYRGDVDPYFAGCDDDGNLFQRMWATPPGSPEDKFMEWSFNDWIYISKGTISYANGGAGDYVAFKVTANATSVTPNGGNTGNCNLVATGLGFNMIVPAAGDGTHDVADVDKIPVPSTDDDGYWDWDLPDTGKGTVSPSDDPGEAQYNLYDAAIPLVRWIRKLAFTGNGTDVIHPETKARRLLPHWTLRVDVHNESLASLCMAWHLDCARKKTT